MGHLWASRNSFIKLAILKITQRDLRDSWCLFYGDFDSTPDMMKLELLSNLGPSNLAARDPLINAKQTYSI